MNHEAKAAHHYDLAPHLYGGRPEEEQSPKADPIKPFASAQTLNVSKLDILHATHEQAKKNLDEAARKFHDLAPTRDVDAAHLLAAHIQYRKTWWDAKHAQLMAQPHRVK